MSKIIGVTYLGVDAAGATIRDAKAKATQKIEALVVDLNTPVYLYVFRGQPWILFRNRWGWTHSDMDRQPGPLCGCGDHDTRAKAERHMRTHAAQNLCQVPGDDCADLIEDKEDLALHKSWFAWQCRVQAWRNSGLGLEQARAKADRGELPESAAISP